MQLSMTLIGDFTRDSEPQWKLFCCGLLEDKRIKWSFLLDESFTILDGTCFAPNLFYVDCILEIESTIIFQ